MKSNLKFGHKTISNEGERTTILIGIGVLA